MYIRVYTCIYICMGKRRGKNSLVIEAVSMERMSPMCIHMYKCINIHMYIHVYTYIYLHIFICIYACLYMCMYIETLR
jgi:hypothetical protein